MVFAEVVQAVWALWVYLQTNETIAFPMDSLRIDKGYGHVGVRKTAKKAELFLWSSYEFVRIFAFRGTQKGAKPP